MSVNIALVEIEIRTKIKETRGREYSGNVFFIKRSATTHGKAKITMFRANLETEKLSWFLLPITTKTAQRSAPKIKNLFEKNTFLLLTITV